MKDNKILKNLYYILSLICYAVSILFFTKLNSNGMGIMWMGFGSILLCLAIAINKKSKNNE